MVGFAARLFLSPDARGLMELNLSADEPIQLAKTSEGKAAEVERLIGPTLDQLGFDIVRVALGGDRRMRLQVMVEGKDGGGPSVEDCSRLSRAIEAILDVEDPIRSAYVLEVSSPGIDRPLTRLKDFQRFAGLDAKVEMLMPVSGRRRFSGKLAGLEGQSILIDCEGERLSLPFTGLQRAKLLLTEELLRQAAEAQKNETREEG